MLTGFLLGALIGVGAAVWIDKQRNGNWIWEALGGK